GAGANAQRADPSDAGLVWRGAGRGDSGARDLDRDHDEPDQDDGGSALRRGGVHAGAVQRHRLFYGYFRFGGFLAEETRISPAADADCVVCADGGWMGKISLASVYGDLLLRWCGFADFSWCGARLDRESARSRGV